MTTRLLLLGSVGTALLAGSASAQQDTDLDLIPKSVQQTAPQTTDAAPVPEPGQRVYLENVVTLPSNRSGLLVPAPPPAPLDWQERALLDVRKDWKLDDQLSVAYSGRFNLRAENDIATPDHKNVVNDLREAYLAWRPTDDLYLDVGRINLKSGTALGFNPTDFFKTRTVVEPLSADPSILREDRLGTLMLNGQYISSIGSATVAAAPAVSHETPIYTSLNLPSFDPMFDRTNAHTRLLVKGSINLAPDFSPELLYYKEGSRTSFGANLTGNFGQNIVGYLEWSGSRRPGLIEDALAFGRRTGTLPAQAPSVLPHDAKPGFNNELSVGASYTTENKITFNLEYHLDQASFTAGDWTRWFAAGRETRRSSPIAGQLWYLRGYALDQQEPISRHSLFLRADWTDAFIPKLELIALTNTDLYDGSSLVQVTVSYYLDDFWTIGGLVSANAGGKRTDFGSLPQRLAALFEITRYF